MSLLKEVKNGNNFLTIIKFTHHSINKKTPRIWGLFQINYTFIKFNKNYSYGTPESSSQPYLVKKPTPEASPVWIPLL